VGFQDAVAVLGDAWPAVSCECHASLRAHVASFQPQLDHAGLQVVIGPVGCALPSSSAHPPPILLRLLRNRELESARQHHGGAFQHASSPRLLLLFASACLCWQQCTSPAPREAQTQPFAIRGALRVHRRRFQKSCAAPPQPHLVLAMEDLRCQECVAQADQWYRGPCCTRRPSRRAMRKVIVCCTKTRTSWCRCWLRMVLRKSP
jgi:hypothetical protein